MGIRESGNGNFGGDQDEPDFDEDDDGYDEESEGGNIFEQRFNGDDGGDKFFGRPGDEEPNGPGSVLAAYEVPAESPADDDQEPVHFECVGYDWARNSPRQLDYELWSWTNRPAELAVLELQQLPPWVDAGGAPGSIVWYRVQYEPTSLRNSDGRMYTNLFGQGTPIRIVEAGRAESALIDNLRPGDFADWILERSASLNRGIGRFLDVEMPSRSGGVAIYDVGQGAWQGVIDAKTALPYIYVDVGGGVLFNRRTFPKQFQRPPDVLTILLSHWDWDHWSSARRYTSLLNAHWFAPPVPKKPIQTRVAMDIHRRGGLTILPLPPGHSMQTGCLRIERCTGSTENDRGLAVTVLSRPRNGRNCLLPGDAAYQYIPSVAHPRSDRFSALCMSHHGGRLHSNDYPAPKRGAVAANSAGPGNTYKPPLFKTLADHKDAGWPMPIQTGTSGSRPCHVFLPWGKRPQLFHGAGALTGPMFSV